MDDRIQRTLDFVESNLSMQASLAKLSDIACMSPSHFHSTFKKETGRTPFKFIEEIKMAKAYQLLIFCSMFWWICMQLPFTTG